MIFNSNNREDKILQGFNEQGLPINFNQTKPEIHVEFGLNTFYSYLRHCIWQCPKKNSYEKINVIGIFS